MVLLWAFAAGCGQRSEPPVRISAANEQLVKICKDDYGFEPVVKPLKNTLWVYVPMSEAMIALKASEAGPSKSDKKETKLTVKFLESVFTDGKFVVRYDIGMSDGYTKDPGYGLPYTDEFKTVQREVITAVGRAYADVEVMPDSKKLLMKVAGDADNTSPEHQRLAHSYVKTEQVPEFVVIVIADILNGLESRLTVYLPDLVRGSTDQLFMEEYTKRLVPDEIFGDDKIKMDSDGSHLDIKEMTWGDFLAMQILHRVRFKYTQSDKKPSDDPADEILNAAAQATGAYQFTAFDGVELHDLAEGKHFSFAPGQVGTFKK